MNSFDRNTFSHLEYPITEIKVYLHTEVIDIETESNSISNYRFKVFLGIKINPDTVINEGLKTMKIPTSKYIVFEHKGATDEADDTYNIFNEWLLQLGMQPNDSTSLQIYDERVYGDYFDKDLKIKPCKLIENNARGTDRNSWIIYSSKFEYSIYVPID